MTTADIISIILLIFIGSCVMIYRGYKRQQYEITMKNTLADKGYKAFCEMLYSKRGKRYFRGHLAKLLQLKAAISTREHEDVRRLIYELNNTRLSSKNYTNYNMDVLGYAVEQKDAALGRKVCQALKKYRLNKRVALEAEQVYDIYLLHKSNHIEELRAFAAKVKNPSSKAMAYFRVAKQYYYLGDEEKCRKYLTMSRNVFANQDWQTIIDEFLEGDLSKLA